MQLLINGIEEKKNAELTKIREDLENEIRQENERFITSMVSLGSMMIRNRFSTCQICEFRFIKC